MDYRLTYRTQLLRSTDGLSYPGSFAANTSIFSIDGGFDSKSEAFAISAAATRPVRCAWRPASLGKTSKMPKVEGDIWIANHAVVAGSCWTIANPLWRKSATSFSLPGLASRRTHKATLTSVIVGSSEKVLSLGQRRFGPTLPIFAEFERKIQLSLLYSPVKKGTRKFPGAIIVYFFQKRSGLIGSLPPFRPCFSRSQTGI